MSNKFEIPLDIPNVTIEGVDINRKGDFVITVVSTEQGTPCHRCGRPLTKRCGHDPTIGGFADLLESKSEAKQTR